MSPERYERGTLRHQVRLAVRFATWAVAATSLTACIIVHDGDPYGDGYDDGWYDEGPALDDQPASVAIDAGATIGSIEPGVGAGIFVELADDGTWRLSTSCDTDLSGYACDYQLFLRGTGLTLTGEEGLERDDDIDHERGAIDLYFLTDSDFDGVTFTAGDAASVTLTAYLDGVSHPDFVYWVGDGIQNEGAPTNPVTFVPR